MGYLLDDSPAGLAAWIIEKFHEWTDGPDERCGLTMDQMLTHVMVYWASRTGASSSRLYWERRRHPETMVPQQRVTVPTGVANFPGELSRSHRSHAERYFNIVHWTELPRGGHFPPPWRCLICSPRTCGRSSGRCVSRYRASRYRVSCCRARRRPPAGIRSCRDRAQGRRS